jgi:hypothetical protein
MQKEEFLMVQVRCAGLLSGTLKSKIKRNHDLERNVTILKAKNICHQSHKYYDDLVRLARQVTKSSQVKVMTLTFSKKTKKSKS